MHSSGSHVFVTNRSGEFVHIKTVRSQTQNLKPLVWEGVREHYVRKLEGLNYILNIQAFLKQVTES